METASILEICNTMHSSYWSFLRPVLLIYLLSINLEKGVTPLIMCVSFYTYISGFPLADVLRGKMCTYGVIDVSVEVFSWSAFHLAAQSLQLLTDVELYGGKKNQSRFTCKAITSHSSDLNIVKTQGQLQDHNQSLIFHVAFYWKVSVFILKMTKGSTVKILSFLFPH